MSWILAPVFVFANIMAESERGMEKWQNEIKAEWRNSRNYPRKRKKAVRKSLELDWQIASWDPFNYK